MAETSAQRALAVSLGARADNELARLFADRHVSPSVTWRDMFDAAEALLEPASVARALPALTRPESDALSAAVAGTPATGDVRDDLVARGLAADDGLPFPSVAEAVREALPDGIPDAVPPPPASASAETATASEAAFTYAASVADILMQTLDAPLGRIGSGSLGATERRRLVEAGAVSTPADADLLVGLAADVGLLGANDRAWLVSPAGREWLRLPTLERWRRTAVGLRDALPRAYRSADGGWIPVHEWAGATPFDPDGPDRAALWALRLRRWGLLDAAGRAAPWAEPLARGGDVDTSALRELLPPEVDRVYLQNDLTAIAPGPLAPHLDVRLRAMAVRESRAQASSYRFSAASIGAAITAGETADSLRDFLTGVSLTGLPQPLAYVIERTSAEHGRVRVMSDPATRLTRVVTDDDTLLRSMEIDQSLRSIALSRTDDVELVSHVSSDVVFWALTDAHYPAVAVDAEGRPRALERAKLAPDARPASDPLATYADLLRRLREGVGDSDAAWLERELDQAVRARAVIDVTVRLPDGSARVFRLEATGLGGGRLRGRDRGADVERTLPLSHIDGVTPVG
ncbi:helicase-associated domain-containing protein [Microbacterium sp. VKM Ac-2923]|uniref:helicase-associated domain-containing protein n=1 Tax=Microbacterium sp. VKM Ac-2923 TaxID=2929476 RepID=UPI001FB1C5A1|nr:helicase-associated domain-containing protein [Microbacterium sp. VKM Ac-2923]MCJ1707180.1 helicase-associated domain-containing protein [Microbacterium sp. VKM Ac-2923]